MINIDPAARRLVDLAKEIAALHARLFDGEAAEAGAIVTGMFGPASTVPPEAMALLAEALGDRYGETINRIWNGDFGSPDDDQGPRGDASLADWIMASELSYHGLRRRISKDVLGELIEGTMRASGAYRDKYNRPWTVEVDGAMVRTTYLGVTIGKAINRQQARLEGKLGASIDWFEKSGEPISSDDVSQLAMVRLRWELAQARATVLAEQTINKSLRAELENKTAYLSLESRFLAKPNEEMNSTQKLVFLELARAAHFLADRGRAVFPLGALAARTGLSKNTVSSASLSICSRPGSPFDRRVYREERRDADGMMVYTSTIELRPLTERMEDTIRAGIALPREIGGKKHGGSPQATEARWRRCPKHPDDDVVVTGHCSVCGLVVGEARVTANAWAGVNHQVGDPGDHPAVRALPKAHTMRDSVSPPGVPHEVPEVLPVQMSLSLVEASLKPQAAWRCPAPHPRGNGRICGSLERIVRDDGSWRCSGRGHESVDYPDPLPLAVGWSG